MESHIREIVINEDPGLLISEAKILAEHIHGKGEATKTQLRRLFSSLKNIDFSWPRRLDAPNAQSALDDAYHKLLLLSPRMAYTSARHEPLKGLCMEIQKGISYVDKNDRKTFERLVEFFEAVLGYYIGH